MPLSDKSNCSLWFCTGKIYCLVCSTEYIHDKHKSSCHKIVPEIIKRSLDPMVSVKPYRETAATSPTIFRHDVTERANKILGNASAVRCCKNWRTWGRPTATSLYAPSTELTIAEYINLFHVISKYVFLFSSRQIDNQCRKLQPTQIMRHQLALI